MSGFSSSAETLIVTVDGREHVGDVIAAGVDTLRMKLEEGGYHIVPVRSISGIQVDVIDGEPIERKFLDWSDGEVLMRVGDRDVAIRDGSITSVLDVGVAAGRPKLSPSASPVTPAPVDAKTAPQNATM